MSELATGVFYGVGVGPGDPELLTRKAERVLTEVDWIFYPAGTRSGASFSRRIVGPLGLAESKFRQVGLGMSRDRRPDEETYRRTVDEIVRELRQGKSAAWITEGDPFFFSTFIYLQEEMRRRYPEVKIVVVPGVTSIGAAAARAGVPVARLDERVAVVPAAHGLDRLPELLADFQTVFLVKISTVFDGALDAILRLPATARAIFVEKVGTSEERVVHDVQSLRGTEVSYFSLLIVQRVNVKNGTSA